MRLLCGFIFILALSLNALPQNITVGAARTNEYINTIRNKTIAIVANHTSTINNTHLVDSLLSLGVKIGAIFSPEHGFRGTADAGEHVENYIDEKTKIPVISLYGNNQKPKKENLNGIQFVIFDIQDVGVRFYTYITTMHYVMEACANEDISFIVLDRPNPNGYYVDGPVLDMKFKSFVGKHPVPLVHGMTVGEYAQMINEEGWLENGKKCKLLVIKCDGYKHKMHYKLPIKPSPNLPNERAIDLYPTLGLFEGTVISCGRGTDFPFQAIGHPEYKDKTFSFKPRSIPGACKMPPFLGETCYGIDLRKDSPLFSLVPGQLNINLIIQAYNNTGLKDKQQFFNAFFTKLAGTDKLETQIKNSIPEDKIRENWKPDIDKFKIIRKKYLLYEDFE